MLGCLQHHRCGLGVREVEPRALGFAWSVLASPQNIDASWVGASPLPKSRTPSLSIPAKRGRSLPSSAACRRCPSSHPVRLDAQSPVASAALTNAVLIVFDYCLAHSTTSPNWVTAVAPEADLGHFLFKIAGAQGAIPAAFPALGFACLGLHV